MDAFMANSNVSEFIHMPVAFTSYQWLSPSATWGFQRKTPSNTQFDTEKSDFANDNKNKSE